MKLILVFICILASTLDCGTQASGHEVPVAGSRSALPAKTVGAIPLPPGYHFYDNAPQGFTDFLRGLPLKADHTVYLFDGSVKKNQQAQFAVLDISVGDKDLQQCADAVMRLRAEYLYHRKQYRDIEFITVSGTVLNFEEWKNGRRFKLKGRTLKPYMVRTAQDLRKSFNSYLEFVFSYCGTASLPLSLKRKKMTAIRAGDILLQPGSPGHAVMVMATARNQAGQKIYLLAQSYMPAQSIHILKNPQNPPLSPWYAVREAHRIRTPEWIFYTDQLYEWK